MLWVYIGVPVACFFVLFLSSISSSVGLSVFFYSKRNVEKEDLKASNTVDVSVFIFGSLYSFFIGPDNSNSKSHVEGTSSEEAI